MALLGEDLTKERQGMMGNILIAVYALSTIVGLAAYLKAHQKFLRSFDWVILSAGTLIGTTCVVILVYFWLRMSGGGGTIRLFVGLFTFAFGWAVPFLTFSYILGHAARKKAMQEGRPSFFPVAIAFVLSALAAPVLNGIFMIAVSFTTLPLLQMLRPFLRPLENILFS